MEFAKNQGSEGERVNALNVKMEEVEAECADLYEKNQMLEQDLEEAEEKLRWQVERYAELDEECKELKDICEMDQKKSYNQSC